MRYVLRSALARVKHLGFRIPSMQFSAIIAIALGLIMAAAILHGLLIFGQLAIEQWQKPILFWDSWSFVQPSQGGKLLWLLQQHNEHRIVWAKLATLMETNLLGRPPASTALFQSLAFTVVNMFLLLGICKNLLHRPVNQTLTWLCCSLILINPWQAENLVWEFQSPWFFTNTLVLALSFAISLYAMSRSGQTALFLFVAFLPWISNFNSGQGLALSVVLCLVCAMLSAKLFIVAIFSSILSFICYFKMLIYSKPAYHPGIGFDIDYFSTLILGGPWQGMGLLGIAIVILVLVKQRKGMNFAVKNMLVNPVLISSLIPAMFAILFAIMTTLSRSGYGVAQASSERYVSHSLMLIISITLTASTWIEANVYSDSETNGLFRLDCILPVLTILTTLMSVPQIFSKQSSLYSAAWQSMRNNAEERRSAMRCIALTEAMAKQGLIIGKSCPLNLYPNANVPRLYFSNQLPVKPLGWHKQLAQQMINLSNLNYGSFKYVIDQKSLSPKFLSLRGWAFEAKRPKRDVFLVAKYLDSKSIVYPVDLARVDVQKVYPFTKKGTGFNLLIPLISRSSAIQQIIIAGNDGGEVIWSQGKEKSNI